MKVFIIGLDGATYRFIHPLIKENKLPTLERLIKDGASAVLRSTIPPASCPAWDSFMTGKNPGKLGVYDVFYRKNGYNIARPDATERRGVSFWNLIGGKSIIVNIPMTFPPEKVDGILIAGRGAPEDGRYTYPDSIKEEINGVAKGYRVTPNHKLTLENLYETLEKRSAVVHYLLEKKWDLFVVNFLATDVVCHGFWGTGEVEKVYIKMDELLSQFLGKLGDDVYVIVMSDHGNGPPSSVFWPNSWLQQEGFLKLKTSPRKRAKSSAIRYMVVMKGLLDRIGLSGFAYKIVPKRIRTAAALPNIFDGEVDWENTVAYSIYGNIPRIFINLRGREPQGTVDPKNYHETREKIIQRLQALKHPALSSITVYRREEIYHGDEIASAPDIVIQFDDFESAYMQPYLNNKQVITPMKPNFGWHRPDGIFIMKGKDVQKGWLVQELHIADIAPLVLHLFNAPVPKDMDGKIRKDIFKKGTQLFKRKVAFVKPKEKEKMQKEALTEEQEEKIIQQLKAIGYS